MHHKSVKGIGFIIPFSDKAYDGAYLAVVSLPTGLITLLYPCNAILETGPVIATENVRKRENSAKQYRIILTPLGDAQYIQDFFTVLIIVIQTSNASLERTHILTLKHQNYETDWNQYINA